MDTAIDTPAGHRPAETPPLGFLLAWEAGSDTAAVSPVQRDGALGYPRFVVLGKATLHRLSDHATSTPVGVLRLHLRSAPTALEVVTP